MSQNSTELIATEENSNDAEPKHGFFGRLSTGSKILLVILAVVLIIALVYAASKIFSSSSSSSPTLPPAGSPETSEATTTTGATVTTFAGSYGNRDPFVPLVAATVTTTASASTTTTSAPSGVVVPTTATTVASQISLVSVSPAGASPTAEVMVGSTSYPGLTVGTTFDNGAYKVTAINQSTACATLTNGGSSNFQLCTGQAVLK